MIAVRLIIGARYGQEHLIVFQGTGVHLLVPMQGCLQPSVTPALRDLGPSSGLPGHMPTHRHTCIVKKIKIKQ